MHREGKNRRGRKPVVSLEEVMDAALEIADTAGLGELTIRGVARKLGVRPMALYAHVESVSDLEDLVFRRAISKDDVTIAPDGDWETQFVEFWKNFRSAMLAHPGAGAIFARRMVPTAETARATDWLFEMLETAGFRDTNLMIAYNTGFYYTFGAFTFELTRPSTARSSLLAQAGSPQELASLRRYAEKLRDVDPDEIFELGLHAVVAGLRALRQ